MSERCEYCGFYLVMDGPRECCRAGKDMDALRAWAADACRNHPDLKQRWAPIERSAGAAAACEIMLLRAARGRAAKSEANPLVPIPPAAEAAERGAEGEQRE